MPSPFPQIHDGRIHAGFFLFIRNLAPRSDRAVLARLGLETFQAVASVDRFDRYVVICDVGEWTLVADDLGYSLYHSATTRPALMALAQEHEIFVCEEGDSDRSFAYQHFVNGALVRDYAVVSPLYSDRKVIRDIGDELPGERMLLKRDGDNISLAVADLLGIPPRVDAAALRLYVPST